MPSTGVILPDGDGTNSGSITDFAGGTTSLFDEINEDPDSSPDDANGIEFPDDTEGSNMFFTLGAMPSDFGTMDTLELEVRAALRDATSDGADQFDVSANIYQSNESTILATLSTPQRVTFDTTFRNYTFTMSGVVGANKTIWDGARIRILQFWNQIKGLDADAILVSAAKLTGEYSLPVSGALKDVIGRGIIPFVR